MIDTSNNTSDRWISTVVSIWIQAIAGGTYAFSVYSPAIKSSQCYDQSTLDTITVFKDIGANIGVLSGLLYPVVAFPSSATGRWKWLRGPWVVLAVGAIQCVVGYLFIWLAVVGLIPRPPVLVMCMFMFLAAQGPTFFSTGTVVTGVLNFPDYSGTTVGIMKGYVGLTGAILIQVYTAFFNGNQSAFILMLALLPNAIAFLLMYQVKICPGRNANDKKHLDRFSMVSLLLAVFLIIAIILEHVIEFPQWARLLTLLLLLVLISLPLKFSVDAIRMEKTHSLIEEKQPSFENTLLNQPHKFEAEKDDRSTDLPSTSDDTLVTKESMDIIKAMKSFDFWLLFISMSCGMGSGLATINNMSQIGQSLGYNMVSVNTLVSLWSIWNFLGRFGSGYISDILLRQKRWTRPLLVAITLATMSIGHLIIASGFSGNLYVGTILVGICYGAQWGLMPTISAEIFGVKHMGTIFNTIGIASPAGTYILSVKVIGHLYDKEAGEDNTCYSIHCFMASFLIMAFTSFLGFLVALILFFRTKTHYKSVVLRRLGII